MRPLVALLSDFGAGSPYVASLKGAILSVCDEVSLVDLTHEVVAQDVRAGARFLCETVPFFPVGTIVVAVVDPGVGSDRRAVAVEAGGYRLVGPDNGLLAPLANQLGVARVVTLDLSAYWRQPLSATFEGRDRFGPVAGWLARGLALHTVGTPSTLPLEQADPEPRVVADARSIRGEIVWTDRFGNGVTNISGELCARYGPPEDATVTVAAQRVVGMVRTYADVASGATCALIGSGGRLEVSVRNGHAAERFGLRPGTPVVVVWP